MSPRWRIQARGRGARRGGGWRRGAARGAPLRAGLLALLLTACSGPILANPPAPTFPLATAAPLPSAPGDPRPIVFPADDGPHHRLTEWWYYTGHLRDEAGGRWGFEYVIFRGERGTFPATWASHLALTDETGGRFVYAQRSQIWPTVDHSPAGPGGPLGFAFALGGTPTADLGTPPADAWLMGGRGGHDRLVAAFDPAEATTAGLRADAETSLRLDLAARIPPVLHHGDGWIDFGPGGGSYYYSRTRMAASGTITIEGRRLAVEGSAWFDHQWGDFVSVGAVGWDWFAVNLADGTDLTISVVRAVAGIDPFVYGTLVGPDGTARQLDAAAFTVTADPARTWTSPRTGATYPAGWTITLPSEGLVIGLTPTVAAQELDTRATTGVVYWEGSQVVRATRAGVPLAGEAYVELTGYAGGVK